MYAYDIVLFSKMSRWEASDINDYFKKKNTIVDLDNCLTVQNHVFSSPNLPTS